MKNYREQIGWQHKSGEDLSPYLRTITPPMDIGHLKLEFLGADEREGRTLHTHTCGDFSLLLSYKGVPGFISSFLVNGDELLVEQLQGVRGKVAFRVATGVDCVTMMADHAMEIGSQLSLARLVMPAPWAVNGVSEEIKGYNAVLSKYYRFASIAGLALSGDKYTGILPHPNRV